MEIQRSRRKRFFRTARWPAAFALIALGTLALVYAVTPLSTPSWTAPGPLAATASTCAGSLTGPVNTLPPGTGTARFDCGGTPSPAAAFTVSKAGADTPSFTLQPGQTSLGYVAQSATDCSTMIGLTNGIPVQLSTGSYDLCIGYTVSSSTTFAASAALSWSS
jgi:hypothetical protein